MKKRAILKSLLRQNWMSHQIFEKRFWIAIYIVCQVALKQAEINQTMYKRTDLSSATTSMFSCGNTAYLWGGKGVCHKKDKLILMRTCKEKNQVLYIILALHFLHSSVKIWAWSDGILPIVVKGLRRDCVCFHKILIGRVKWQLNHEK